MFFDTAKRLRMKYDYVDGNNMDKCVNCKHMTSDYEDTQGENTYYACVIDSDPFLPDGSHNPQQEAPYQLKDPWGVCDQHERKKRNRIL